MDWSLIASAVLGAVALVLATGLIVARRRRTSSRRYALRSLPPLVIPADGPGVARPAHRSAVAAAQTAWADRAVRRPVVPDGDVAAAVRAETAPYRERWRAVDGEDGGDGSEGRVNAAPRRAPHDLGSLRQTAPFPSAAPADGLEPAPSADRTVRVQRPMEETLQFLPGRLEITEGEDRGQSIRFVRLFGEPPVVTFGRSAGPAHRHVQLKSLTVSRLQARMRYEGRRWEVTNLSETNPTLVNGDELRVHGSRLLEHGDRIEMGEVVFRFWEY